MLRLQVADRAMLEDYYKSAYGVVRGASSSCFVIIAPREYELDGAEWQTFMDDKSVYTGVMQEVHRCGAVVRVKSYGLGFGVRDNIGSGSGSPRLRSISHAYFAASRCVGAFMKGIKTTRTGTKHAQVQPSSICAACTRLECQ